MPNYQIAVNGRTHAVQADADTPALYVLRNDLGLNGPKFGCGLAQCGACTVIHDGQAIRSCVTPVGALAEGRTVTMEGLAAGGRLHPVQQALVDEEAAQCGYCANAWLMTMTAALEKNPRMSEAELRQALSGLKCRCGTHMAFLRAARKAGAAMAAAAAVQADAT